MSLLPIKAYKRCLNCEHEWVEYQNTLDVDIKPCPRCGDIDVFGRYREVSTEVVG